MAKNEIKEAPKPATPDPNAPPPVQATAREPMSAAEAKAQDMDTTKTDTYYVTGPGGIWFKGQQHGMGSVLQLNELEAASLGTNVARGSAAPTDSPTARGAGKYRVTGPGLVMHNGKQHGAGAVLDLSEADARSLG